MSNYEKKMRFEQINTPLNHCCLFTNQSFILESVSYPSESHIAPT